MPPPRKKRPPAGQSVPDAGTISAHRDALRRSSRAAGQKPPERGLKNSPRRRPGAVRRLRPWESGGHGGSGAGKAPHWAPAGAEGMSGRKNSPRRSRRLCAGCAPWGNGGHHVRGGVWKVPHLASAEAGGMPGRKNSPRRAPEAVWMRDMGVTCPGRSV